nr:hypothetical protein [Bacilli bacterium]
AREIILTEKGKERIETLYRELRELGDLLQAKLGLNEEGASELALIIATECDPSIKHSLLG